MRRREQLRLSHGEHLCPECRARAIRAAELARPADSPEELRKKRVKAGMQAAMENRAERRKRAKELRRAAK